MRAQPLPLNPRRDSQRAGGRTWGPDAAGTASGLGARAQLWKPRPSNRPGSWGAHKFSGAPGTCGIGSRWSLVLRRVEQVTARLSCARTCPGRRAAPWRAPERVRRRDPGDRALLGPARRRGEREPQARSPGRISATESPFRTGGPLLPTRRRSPSRGLHARSLGTIPSPRFQCPVLPWPRPLASPPPGPRRSPFPPCSPERRGPKPRPLPAPHTHPKERR